jgi:hypothetical protein
LSYFSSPFYCCCWWWCCCCCCQVLNEKTKSMSWGLARIYSLESSGLFINDSTFPEVVDRQRGTSRDLTCSVSQGNSSIFDHLTMRKFFSLSNPNTSCCKASPWPLIWPMHEICHRPCVPRKPDIPPFQCKRNAAVRCKGRGSLRDLCVCGISRLEGTG